MKEHYWRSNTRPIPNPEEPARQLSVKVAGYTLEGNPIYEALMECNDGISRPFRLVGGRWVLKGTT